MSSEGTRRITWKLTAPLPSKGGCFRSWRSAEPKLWGDINTDASTAATRKSSTTAAATAIVRSARLALGRIGSPRGKKSFCRCRTSMSSSRFRTSPLALQNKRLVYGILFRAASETLLAIARDPKHLGAEIGFVAVLHTWGQTLQLHPHLHCVIPGGGLSPDGRRWVSCNETFFLPVAVLRRLFRGKFLAYLQKAFDDGELQFFGKIEQLARATSWKRFVQQLRSVEWVLYCKPPFGSSEQAPSLWDSLSCRL